MAACPIYFPDPHEPMNPVVSPSPEPHFMPEPAPKPGTGTNGVAPRRLTLDERCAELRERMLAEPEDDPEPPTPAPAVAKVVEIRVEPKPKKFVVPIFPKKQTAKPEAKPFEWNRSKCLAMSHPRCVKCHGVGMTFGRGLKMVPCGCVTRKAFNSCLGKYKYIQAYQDRVTSCVPVLIKHGSDSRFCWSRKNEEFLADFVLVAKRTIQDARDWQIFELHMLQGRDWRACTKVVGLDRGTFFHRVYKIQEACGKAFMETQPYALCPLDQYFSTVCVNTAGSVQVAA